MIDMIISSYLDLDHWSGKVFLLKLKMKLFIVFVAIVAGALAVPIDDSKDAVILKYENDNIGVDGYKFA